MTDRRKAPKPPATRPQDAPDGPGTDQPEAAEPPATGHRAAPDGPGTDQPAPTPRPPVPTHRGGRVASTVLAVLVCGLTASAALVPLAVVGSFRPWLGLPLVAVVTATLVALWRPDRAVVADAGAPRWFLPAALGVVVVVVGPSAVFTNAHAIVDRDPGVYLSTAVFARSQDTLVLPPPAGPFGDVPGVIERTPAEPRLGGDLRGFQGLHLLPAQAGALGWVGGDALMLRASALLAACGLLLLMALARRLVGAVLALVTGVALGTSLPFAYLSRDLYSEWPLFALLAGGLWALDTALAERSPTRAAVAGAAIGAATMARIDGLATVGGLVLVVGLWAVVAGRRPDGEGARRTRVAGAAAVTAALGWLAGMADGWIRARRYLEVHQAEILGQLAIPAAALATVGAVAMVGPARLCTLADRVVARVPGGAPRGSGPVGGRPPRSPARGDGPWVAPRAVAIAAGLAVVALAVLAVVVRPAFPSATELPPSPITAGLQAAEGEPVDPGRTYAELSGRWLVWYLGAGTVVAATAGGALLVARWARGRRVRVEALVAAVVGPPLVLYLARPSIYPDQPWASRRFLPAVLPGVLLAAAWLARRLWDRRHRAGAAGPAAGVAAAVVALAMVAHPVVVLAPLVRMRQHTGEVAMVRSLCAQVPADAALLTVALPAEGWVPPLTTFCDRPAAGVVDPDGPDRATVERLAAAWAAEGRPLWLVGPAGAALTPLGARPTVSVSSEDDLVLRFSLTERPRHTRDGRLVLVAGPVTTAPA